MGIKELIQKKREELAQAKEEDRKELETNRVEEVMIQEQSTTQNKPTLTIEQYLIEDANREAQGRLELMRHILRIETLLEEYNEKIGELLK